MTDDLLKTLENEGIVSKSKGCEYKLDCYAFSLLDRNCVDLGGGRCRMYECFNKQKTIQLVIPNTGDDEDLQIELGDVGLIRK